MTLLRPRALTPPEQIDVAEFERRVVAALAEVGCDHELDAGVIRYRPGSEAIVWQAQRLALESLGIPYELELVL